MNPVREFQRKYNLAADGIIGPETRGKAEEVIKGLVNRRAEELKIEEP